ncbi:MAG: DUF378 domain-containing protein [Firmicutes bacterium]|mgnify:CR=1 FL=1|nr:DUF378 domain-containing protein [Bacillota bacterium]
MQGLRTVSLILTIIGALNWGLIGLFNWNLVEAIFGGSVAMPSMLSRIIYSLVGLSGLYLLLTMGELTRVREE